MSINMRQFTRDNLTITYKDAGPEKEEPLASLVILSGWGYGAMMGEVAFGSLRKEGVRIITIDLPGTGNLTGNSSFVHIPRLAKTVAALLRELNLNEITIVGHSFGTMVAQEMAITEDDVVGKMVLISPLSGVGGTSSSLMMTDFHSVIKTLNRMLSGRESVLDFLYPSTYLDTLQGTLGELFGEINKPTPVSALSGQIWAASRWTNWGRLGQMYQPTLIIQGMNDPLTSIDQTRHISEGLPNSHLLELPQSGYLPFLEQSRVVHQQTMGFVMAEDDILRY